MLRDLGHIHQTTELAERVLLPGDPGRALRIAQELLDKPKMLNHNRGLWGYTGAAPDGELLSIQSTGIGGPSAAIVLTELIELGARRVIRVGSCRALDPSIKAGTLLVVEAALADDGTSRALGGHERLARVVGPGTLTAKLLTDGGIHSRPPATVVSTDLFYDGPGQWPGAAAVDLETAAIFTVAARHGIEAAAVLMVAGDESVELAMGRLAIAALS